MRAARASLPAASVLAVLAFAVAAQGGGSDLRPDFRRAACASPPFPIDALRGPTGADREDHPSAEALRNHPSYVVGGPWRLLKRTQRIAVYAAGNLPSIVSTVLLNDPERGWGYGGSTSSSCTPEVVRRGIPASSWTLDREFRAPRPSDTRLHLLVAEKTCSSGQPAGRRIQEPRVFRRRGGITITYFVRPRPGPQTCQGSPPTAVTLELAEPIGDRRLLDGRHVIRVQRFP